MQMKKRYYILGGLSLLLFILFFSLSTLVKNWVINNSEKLIGRKVQIGELHFNYARVALQVKELVVYETNKVDSFISFQELYINFNPWMLTSNEYNFSEIRLVTPKISVIQDNNVFNFTSMIPPKDSTEAEVDTTESKKILKFTIHNLLLDNGEVKYANIQKKSDVKLNKLRLNLPLLAWDNEKSNMGVEFLLGEKGRVNINGTVDNINQKYQINLKTDSIDIQMATNYLKDYLEVTSVNGFLGTDLKIVGDMSDLLNIAINGTSSVSKFELTDGDSNKIMALDKLSVNIAEINLKDSRFNFSKIEVSEPSVVFVHNRNQSNFEKLLAPLRKDTVAATPDTDTSSSGVNTTYRVDTLKIISGKVDLTDNTLNRKFEYTLNNLNVTMTGLSQNATQIPVTFDMLLNKGGELRGKTTWSMVEPLSLKLDASIKRMNLLSFSPYSEFFIASPMNQGWFNYDISVTMAPTNLVNSNTILVDELEFGKRTNDATATKVPVRLGLYLMKDVNDQIKIDLPITGNPSDPEFRLGKIIWKTFGNLMYKVAASPFMALADLAGTNPESLEKLPFEYGQDSLTVSQREKLTQLATILKKKPDLLLTLTQTTNPELEKLQLAIIQAKRDYLNILATDSTAKMVEFADLKTNDAKFIDFIRKSVPAVDSIGFEKACRLRADAASIELQFVDIVAKRNAIIEQFFIQEQGLTLESVNATTADLPNLPQELQIPQYKIEVSIK